MKTKSLHFKIYSAIILTAAVIGLIFGAILYPFQARRHDSEVKRVRWLLGTVFEQKREDLANELFAGQARALEASLKELLQVEGITGIAIYHPEGTSYLSTEGIEGGRLEDPERQVLEHAPTFELVEERGSSMGVYSTKIEVIGRNIGYIKLYYDFTTLEGERRQTIALFLMLLVATLLLMSVLLSFLLSRFVIRPVFLLRNAMQRVEEGHLGETVPLSSRDEIGKMGIAFNKMSVRLSESREAQRKAEEKYRSIFENAIEGVFQSTTGKGRYITVNPSMAATLGYGSPHELVTSVAEIATELFVEPEDARLLERLIQEQGQVVDFQTRFYRRDRTVIWVSLSIRGISDAEGNLLHYEGSFLDITERREKEQAERERKAAEAASKAKSEFLAYMSHEIRTPMNAILGFSDLLSPLVTDPKQNGHLQSIRSSAKSLLSLINGILDLSKIEAGKMEIQYEPLTLFPLLEEVKGIFSLQVSRKQLEFVTDISAELISAQFLLDELRLRQVLFNLVGNAVKFTEKGFIKLTARRGPSEHDGAIALSILVEDTGIGIDPGSQKEIFQSFKQRSGQSAKIYGGTGLGLAISKNLVEMMGGRLSVQSESGSGSTFSIELPRVALVAGGSRWESAHNRDSTEITLENTTVLVADDLESDTKLTRGFVQGRKGSVVEAENGRIALELARRYKPCEIPTELIARLKQDLWTQWESARRRQHIPDIEDFGRRVKALGEEYGIGTLMDYAEELLEHVNDFDVDGIRYVLESYPRTIEKIDRMRSRHG